MHAAERGILADTTLAVLVDTRRDDDDDNNVESIGRVTRQL